MIARTLYVILVSLCLLLPPKTGIAAPPACSSATEGTILYNKAHKLVQFCNGTAWIGLTAKIGGAGDTLSDLNCLDGQIIKYTGSNWTCAEDSGGLASLQGTDDPAACTPEKDGLIRYNGSNDPQWEYCHGGTTSWLPFRLPQCQDDDTGACTLAALRNANDPQFKASSIRCGDNLLGVTGTYGSGSAAPFTFTDISNAALSTLTAASALTISGIPAGCPGEVAVSGQGSPQISINGGTWGTMGSISNGQTLAVRLTSSPSFSTAHTATISIGATEDSWSVTTFAADTTPNAFSFSDQTNAALSTLMTSNSITISGINTTTPVSVTGTGAQISINGGGWVTSGTITNGQTLTVRLTSSASFNTAMTATVNVGGVTDGWSVTTRAANNCTVASGTAWAVSGKTCTSPSALAVSHGSTGSRTDSTEPTTGTATWSCNDGTATLQGGSTCVESCSANQTVSWSTNCTAQSGVLLANGAGRSVTNTAVGYSGTRTITCNNGTLDQSGGSCTGTDSTPNAFTFTDVTGQALSTLITSNTITISGLTTGASVSVSGSGSPKISINGGAWVTSGTITNGQSLRVQLTSSASFSTALSATVDVGGVTDSWSVTTRAANGCTVASGTTWAVSGKTCTTPSALTLAHGASGSRTDSTEPTTGSKTFTCTDGSIGQSGTPTCVESCAASQTVTWSTNCTALSGTLLANGANRSITNSASGYAGTRTITCNNGTLAQSGGSCTSTCGGYLHAGYCWYMGANNQSCDQVCSSHGGCDVGGIRNYTGSGSSSRVANCKTLLDHFGIGSGTVGDGYGNASGCYYNGGASAPKRRIGEDTTTCADKNSAYRRLCSCDG